MGRKYPDADPCGRQEGDYATGSSRMTGISRGAAEDHRRVLAVLTYLRR